MAVPSWNLAGTTDVYINGAGNFTAFGGGPAGLNTETDYYILDGSGGGTPSCQSKNAWAGALRGMMQDEAGTDLAVGTDEAVMVWTIYHVPNALTARSGATEQGLSIRVGTSTTVNWFFVVGDDTELLFETWVPWVVNFDNSLETGQNGTPSAAGTVDWVGASWNVSSSGPTKGAPAGIDGIRYGRFEMQYRAGEAADYNTFAKTEAFANSTTRRWGVLEERAGTYQMQGFHSFGDASNAVDFRDSDVVLFIRDTPFVTAGFNRIEIENASTNVDWTNILITSLGTQSPGTFVVTSGAFDAIACQFTNMGTFDFLSSSSATDSVFRGCGAITAPGTDLSGSLVAVPSVAADTAAVVWDTATDTDGLLDGMSFEKHGTTDHHAIEFTTFATSFDLVGIDFSGFGAEAANSAALYFPDTGSDRAWVVNLIGVTGTVNFKKVRAGDTVSLVIDPVTLTVTVEGSGAVLSGARVMASVLSAAGGWPYQESVTSITQSAGVATATHTAHGLSTNDWVLISGVTNGELYNGVHQITVTGVNTYTFSVDSGLTSPATGTITATFVVMQGTTNGSGVITATYSYTADQPVRLRTRSASGSPYYKADVRAVTIDSASGANQTVALILDE